MSESRRLAVACFLFVAGNLVFTPLVVALCFPFAAVDSWIMECNSRVAYIEGMQRLYTALADLIKKGSLFDVEPSVVEKLKAEVEGAFKADVSVPEMPSWYKKLEGAVNSYALGVCEFYLRAPGMIFVVEAVLVLVGYGLVNGGSRDERIKRFVGGRVE